MVLNPQFQVMATMVVGFFSLLPCFLCVLRIYFKFHQDNTERLQEIRSNHELQLLTYASSVTPLIIVQFLLCFLILTCLGFILKDVVIRGPLVWSRDSFGELLQQLIGHSCVLVWLFRLKHYISLKEQRAWRPDDYSDELMDFYSAFKPIFVLLCLFLIKVSCLRTE